MRKEINITADPRLTRGKNAARRTRVSGQIPATLYGIGKDAMALSVSPKEMGKILRSATGHNTIFNLQVAGGDNEPVMLVDWQKDPVKSTLLHVDLKRIDLTKRLLAKVPVHTTGEPKGVKVQGGIYEIISRDIEVECLPDDIPESLTVDVVELMLGQSLRASGVALPPSVKLVSPPDQVISHVIAIRVVVEEAAPVEGAAPAAAAEPEVIKKGKKEEEGAAPAEKEKEKEKEKKK